MKLRIRPAAKADLMLVFNWANDPAVRSASFAQDPIPLETHREWFLRTLDSGTTNLLIVEGWQDGEWQPVAQVRFDSSGEVGISLDRAFRGKGLGTRVLREAAAYAAREYALDTAIAHIKHDNGASIRTFEKAGFKLTGEAIVKGYPCLEYRLDLTGRADDSSEAAEI